MILVDERDERLTVFQGPRGPRGNQGNMGNQGNPGNQGGQGGRGEPGERGERGTAGLSVPVRRALVFLFVLNVLLAGANMLWTAHQVTRGSAAAVAVTRALCESSNVARAQSIQLWDFILDLPASAPPTAAQEKRTAAFRAFLGKAYQPRNCAHISPGNP